MSELSCRYAVHDQRCRRAVATPPMSDTPIAKAVAADLGMTWPLQDPPKAPDVNQARLAEWCVTARPPQHMEGQLSDSGVGGSPEGCGPAPTGPHPPQLP